MVCFQNIILWINSKHLLAPFSALDSESELVVQDALDNVVSHRNVTTVVIVSGFAWNFLLIRESKSLETLLVSHPSVFPHCNQFRLIVCRRSVMRISLLLSTRERSSRQEHTTN